MKRKVLLVGEHPMGFSGNSHMMCAVANQIDLDQFEPIVFSNSSSSDLNIIFKYPVIEGGGNSGDYLGTNRLLKLIKTTRFDFIVFVGIDVWVYAPVFQELVDLRNKQKWIWVSIFPYDLISLRKDWLHWINAIDYPCVYSEYGYNILKDHVANLHYFRPPLHDKDQFVQYAEHKRMELKNTLFSAVKDKFIFGFFGNNQIRKDPQRFIKAFFLLKRKYPDIAMYFHTDFNKGIYNLEQYIRDCGGGVGDIIIKKQDKSCTTTNMVETYNSIDCLVNVSLQEGLSWTIIEAMLCGVPVIMSDTTAHKDYLTRDLGLGVECTDLTYLPLIAESGPSFIETRACDVDLLVHQMEQVFTSDYLRTHLIERGLKFSRYWADSPSDLNSLFSITKIEIKEPERLPAVLFAQHSSAGDVFMTTRCFKGIKERYNLPLHFMTSPKYMDILKNNPYIDKVIPWNDDEFVKYQFVLNPHGERIAPGHWGRNSNSLLSDFYWKILKVEPDDFFIEQTKPDLKSFPISTNTNKPILIVHTTGGDAHFRTYKYMKDVCEAFPEYLTIQVGGKDDFCAYADVDLRGKLTFGETAWVVSKAEIAVTVDSFISHLVGALGVSQVCLFGSGNENVVKPNQVSGKLICMSPDYVNQCPGLGPCSAGLRDCPLPCTGIHDPLDVINNLRRLI
jgi:ADP-heptose:LPS heptosyltransferase/glycosyltransferase involved in cell wall biosynthesis